MKKVKSLSFNSVLLFILEPTTDLLRRLMRVDRAYTTDLRIPRTILFVTLELFAI